MSSASHPPIDIPPEHILRSARVATLAMATLAELRESDTHSHLLRLRGYVQALTRQLKTMPQWGEFLHEQQIRTLCDCVPLYDMGNIGIPDRVLLKPGRLSPEEIAIMRTHTTVGYEALVKAELALGGTTELLTMAKETALSHHERWNGKGYPHGLAGTQIPPAARIVALADVYDALISSKVYRDGISHAQAVGVIFGERGEHFDPDVVDAFMEVEAEFAQVASQFADTDEDMQQKIEYLANAIAEVAVL